MEKDHFLKILSKMNDKIASEEERGFYEAYDRLFDAQPDGLSNLSAAEVRSLQKRIRAGIDTETGERRVFMPVLRRVPRWWAAAAMVVMVSAVLTIYFSREQQQLISYTGNPHTIFPGNKGAVLTLANGKRIDLSTVSDGIVAAQGNTRIAKTKGGLITYSRETDAKAGEKPNWNSIVTPRGSIAAIALPDGSKAYLNAGSSLRFPAMFSSSERVVELSGEAEFEVLHQPSKPFRVISAGQKVEVLGTHFNINTYTGGKIARTTLLEGRIALSTASQRRILKPGEQASITSGHTSGEINVRQLADAGDAVAWRNGIFHFDNAGIQEVMDVFSLWYDVDITVEAGVRERLFSGDIHKTLTLQKALQLLNYHRVYFDIDGRKIRVRS
jgi:transmembrane sensor